MGRRGVGRGGSGTPSPRGGRGFPDPSPSANSFNATRELSEGGKGVDPPFTPLVVGHLPIQAWLRPEHLRGHLRHLPQAAREEGDGRDAVGGARSAEIEEIWKI